MVTLAQVAKEAGVSKSTASRALSGSRRVSSHTRERVANAASLLGYVGSEIARGLATGKSKRVALVVPAINRWFYGEIIDGVETALSKAGYSLSVSKLTSDSSRRSTIFDLHLARNGVDAVIAVTLLLTQQETQKLRELGRPVVGIGGALGGISTLSIDDSLAAAIATNHLISLGHRRIDHVGGSPATEMDFAVPLKRLSGFREALRDKNLSHEAGFYPSDFSAAGGYQAASSVLTDRTRKPTAIFAASDEIAVGVIHAVCGLGIRIPDELSVIGIDGNPIGYGFGLTTIDQHIFEQGKTAAAIALAELSEKSPSGGFEHLTMETSLRLGTSTGPRRPL